MGNESNSRAQEELESTENALGPDATSLETWNLVPLTPGFIESEHGGYAAAIVKALDDPLVRNIALSGNYGVGKSSILKRVSQLKEKQVVELSLSTLAPIEQSALDESVPAQATTPTNRIQQEIVKQLLYREEPNRAPGSRFRRIERFNPLRELGLASLGGLVATTIFVILGWGARIAETLLPLVDAGLWVYLAIYLAATGGMFAVRALLHGRVQIKQFSAGPAAVTLDEKSVTYFDQYLDEVVYFFETSKRDIVIFEDIDRFNDSHIFETLRSLNTLLNASPQIKGPVRFIYAIKDSIVDRIGLETEGRKVDAHLADIKDPAQAEAVRANRTKFFDLVIPVVPFITHRSARNLTTQILRGIEHDVSDDLIDLAGRFVPDMRLLKNVRNEFVVFRDRIFSGDGGQLELSETDLFAMMLYKSTHLSDFEVIRLGKSRLDRLYEVHRELVTVNIRRLDRDIRATRQELARAGNAATRSTRLGERLIAHIGRTARSVGFNMQSQQYIVAGNALTAEQLRGAEFWRQMSSDESKALQWRNNYGHSMSFSRSDLEEALNESLDAGTWKQADSKALNQKLQEQLEDLKFVRSADMGEMMKRSDFVVEFDGAMQSLESVAERMLESRGLAFQLIRAGYIDRNFTLYTSTFHGDRVSPAATNFIIHHVERDLMDEHFELTDEDVDAVIRERGRASLGEPALFNIAILDHLLRSDLPAARIMTKSLARFDADANRFLQAYLAGGTERASFVALLANHSAGVFGYLVSTVELDDDVRLELVDRVLATLSSGREYRVDDETSKYLADHYTDLPVLRGAKISAPTAALIAIVFETAGVRVRELTLLSSTAQKAFVDRDLFQLTIANLQAALGNKAGLALDSIRDANSRVYSKVLGELSAYLDVTEGTAVTNDTAAGFKATIEDVLEADPDHLETVIRRASPSSRVTSLSDLPEAAWPSLARYDRFPASFSNVAGFIENIDAIDTDLAVVLNAAEVISDAQDLDEAEKVELATTLLAARDVVNARQRVRLVESLGLQEQLDVDEITPEQGSLFPLLLGASLIADDADTYARIRAANWPTRESVLRASPAAKDLVSPAFVGSDLAQLLTSDGVHDAVKVAVLTRADKFSASANRDGLTELARQASTRGMQLNTSVIEVIVRERVPASLVVSLLEPHLPDMPDSELFTILRSLPGDYQQLTRVGRDKPKIQNTPGAVRLLESMKTRGIVTGFDPKADPIKVNKRYK